MIVLYPIWGGYQVHKVRNICRAAERHDHQPRVISNGRTVGFDFFSQPTNLLALRAWDFSLRSKWRRGGRYDKNTRKQLVAKRNKFTAEDEW